MTTIAAPGPSPALLWLPGGALALPHVMAEFPGWLCWRDLGGSYFARPATGREEVRILAGNLPGLRASLRQIEASGILAEQARLEQEYGAAFSIFYVLGPWTITPPGAWHVTARDHLRGCTMDPSAAAVRAWMDWILARSLPDLRRVLTLAEAAASRSHGSGPERSPQEAA